MKTVIILKTGIFHWKVWLKNGQQEQQLLFTYMARHLNKNVNSPFNISKYILIYDIILQQEKETPCPSRVILGQGHKLVRSTLMLPKSA